MKPMLKRIFICGLLAALAAGCQVTAARPEGAVITADNAAQLSVARQAEISAPYELAWAADGSALLVLQENGAARLDAQTLSISERLKFEIPMLLVSIAPDGHTLAYSEDGSSIHIKDIRSENEVLVIDPGEQIGSLDFSPDGQSLLGSSMEAFAVRLWDTASGAEISRLEGFESAAPVYTARFGADGEHILWISRGTVQPMEIASGRLGPEIGHEDFVNAAALSPDGSLVATGSAGTVRGEFTPVLYLWDAASGDALGTLPYSEPFSNLVFSPDSRLIAAASGGRITIWDAADPQLLAELDSGADFVRALAFSPDGITLASASSDGVLVIWQVK